jgi:RNA polymerase sigma factor (sigma-70 family)
VFHHHNPNYQSERTSERLRDAAAARRVRDARDVERAVRAAANGDASAWASLVERFGARVRGVARSHGLNAHDVDDVQQATWLRLLVNIDRVREPAAIGGWLETTARRESLRVLRRTRRSPVLESDSQHEDADDRPTIEEHVIEVERGAALRAGVARLPDTQRALLELMLAEPSPTYDEISATLGMPIGSIGPTRQRTLARLRKDEVLISTIAGADAA